MKSNIMQEYIDKLSNLNKNNNIKGFDGWLRNDNKNDTYGYKKVIRYVKIINSNLRYYLDFCLLNQGGCPCCSMDKPVISVYFKKMTGYFNIHNKPVLQKKLSEKLLSQRNYNFEKEVENLANSALYDFEIIINQLKN